jgi:putative redox protein
MIEINVTYKGKLHCEAEHKPSGRILKTDASEDSHGKAENFSPTDLAAAALGTSLLTVMGTAAEERNIDISGTTCRVEKHMSADKPRRIVKLVAEINFCPDIPLAKRGLLEAVAVHCPIVKSIKQDIELDIRMHFPDGQDIIFDSRGEAAVH